VVTELGEIVGIIAAMDEEIEILRAQCEHAESTSIAGNEFTSGWIDGVHVVLLKCGIGKVNAAIGTTLLHQLFKPSWVINTGSAGGLLDNLSVGDVVVSSEVRYHDVDVTAFGYEYGQIPSEPAGFAADTELVEVSRRAVDKLDGIKAHVGLIASGDSFMSDPSRVAAVRQLFPDLAAVEMEAAAIAHVCAHFSVPFVAIRALSDIAGKDSSMSFEQFLHIAARHSSQVVRYILREVVEQ
jgi:adenosylhomocysteine nucleosidase